MPGRMGNDAVMRLNELSIGSTATIREVGGSGALRQHFLDMGLIQGTEVTVIKYAPMGDPIELRIHGYELTIRLEDAKTIGGLGPCGRKLCCSSWLGDFQPVSIKMAKDQSLSLNPTKISGICGRLFCCLKYEHDVYAEAIDAMPVVGALVKVDEAKGKVIEVNPLLEQVRIEFNDKTIKVCHKDEVKVLHEPKKCGGCGSLRDEGLDEATLRELKKLED